jgi:hypothetical protein
MRLNHGWKFANANACQQSGCEAGEIVDREVRLKGNGFLALSVLVQKGPAPFRLAAPEREQPMIDKILGTFRRLVGLQIRRAGNELASVCQDFPTDQ